jgi:D-alanyl-D-alanine dipeptidase
MKRKITATAAAKRHMESVASIGCIVCILKGYGETPAQVHHIREGRIARDDFLTIPLCEPHHTGTTMSVHMRKEELLASLRIGSEFDLLADVMRRMAK